MVDYFEMIKSYCVTPFGSNAMEIMTTPSFLLKIMSLVKGTLRKDCSSCMATMESIKTPSYIKMCGIAPPLSAPLKALHLL